MCPHQYWECLKYKVILVVQTKTTKVNSSSGKLFFAMTLNRNQVPYLRKEIDTRPQLEDHEWHHTVRQQYVTHEER